MLSGSKDKNSRGTLPTLKMVDPFTLGMLATRPVVKVGSVLKLPEFNDTEYVVTSVSTVEGLIEVALENPLNNDKMLLKRTLSYLINHTMKKS